MLLNHTQAESKWPNCAYQGEYSGKVGFGTAKVTTNGKSVIFNTITVYEEKGSTKDLNFQDTWSRTRKSIDVYNFEKNKSLKYIDDNGDNKELNISNYMLNKKSKSETCPQYLIIFNNGRLGVKNFEVLIGDDNLKNYLESNIPENNYNFFIFGQNIDPSDLSESELESPEEEEEIDVGEATCSGILGNYDTVEKKYVEGTTGALIQQIFNYMKLAAVVMVFAFSVIDYAKALIDQNQDLFKTANKKFGKRLIFGVLVFLLPLIVNLIVGIIDSSTCGIG